MRAVDLTPPELKARQPGEGDPRVAYGIVGGLALLFLMVVLTITYSNKATTLNDQAAALTAEAGRHKVAAKPVEQFNDFAGVAESRTLLVGGLAASRFPWGNAVYNLSRSLPEDVTLTTIVASTAGAQAAAANQGSGAAGVSSEQVPSLTLSGCTSGWVGYSRLQIWLKNMPGVADVTSTSSDASGGTAGVDSSNTRTKNCGPSPLNFSLSVTYQPRKVNLVGLPQVKAPSAPAAGATGATGAAPAPAAATTGGAE